MLLRFAKIAGGLRILVSQAAPIVATSVGLLSARTASQDAPTLPPKIEYNPFLPEKFVPDRAISYYLVDGDRFRGLRDNDWKNLESLSGWDKGYWKSEQTDSECRGWRPGWSRKIK